MNIMIYIGKLVYVVVVVFLIVMSYHRTLLYSMTITRILSCAHTTISRVWPTYTRKCLLEMSKAIHHCRNLITINNGLYYCIIY